jgi:hypothetical protein
MFLVKFDVMDNLLMIASVTLHYVAAVRSRRQVAMNSNGRWYGFTIAPMQTTKITVEF